MSSAWIRRRAIPPSGRHPKGRTSFQVLYRRGGRYFPAEYAGTFRTQREAKLRRDLVAGWLAQGLDPRAELARLQADPTVAPLFSEAQAAMLRSRVDVSDSTRDAYERWGRLLDTLIGDRRVDSLTAADAQGLVEALVAHPTASGTMRPASVRAYFGQARQVLDHARVRPNPFRDELVRLPRNVAEEPSPPTAREVVAIAERLPARHLRPFVVLETTGMRVGELAFPWGDVDVAGCRVRLTRAATKTSRPRWVQLPDWLMGWVADTCPVEDRTAGRRVFPTSPSGLRHAMYRACALAGIAAYSPHDLRHRRISLWHGQGLPWREIADRVGHVKPSMTLDVYSHVLLERGEVTADEWEAVLAR